MQFRRTPKFKDDFLHLDGLDQRDVTEAFIELQKALLGDTEQRQRFRLKKMEGWPGIWEGHIKINLCFTFHIGYDKKEKVCFFRRIGTHDIYRKP